MSKTLDCFHRRSDSKDGLHPHCKVCVKKYTAQYYLDNLEQIKAHDKKYRENNPEKTNAATRKWRVANPEKPKQYRANNKENISVTDKKWRLANLEKKRNQTIAYRVRKLTNGVYKILDKELKKLYASPCFYCGSSDSIQADHIIPISKGGQHSIGNLVPACSFCNQSKSNKLLVEWRAIR